MITRRAALLLGLSLFAAAAPAMDPDEQLLFANGLYRRGLHDLAAPEFQTLLDSPAAAALHDLAAFRLGECLRQTGRTNEAAAAFDRVIEEFPASSFRPRALFRRAELDEQAGRLADAARRYEALLAEQPSADIAAAGQYHLALTLDGLDRAKDAEKNLKALLKRDPDSSYADYARLALAGLLERRGAKPSTIAPLFATVAERATTPTLGAEAAARAGLLAYRTGEHTEAARWLADLAARFPDSPWIARTRLEAGWSFLLDGQPAPARAAADLGLAQAEADDRPLWRYLRANIARRSSDPATALTDYEALLSEAPDHELAPSAALEAAVIAAAAAQPERALALADRIIADPERGASARWIRAAALRSLGRADEAAAAYRALLEEQPDAERAPEAAYQLALLAEEAGDLPAAASAFAALADRYPAAPLAADAAMAAASVHLRLGEPAAAAGHLERLLADHPDHAARDEARLALARIRIDLDQPVPAAAILQPVLDAATNRALRAQAHYLRGVLFEQEELFAESEFHYLRALGLKPPAELARSIQHRRVTVLQRQGKNDEAAELLNKLIADGEAQQIPSPLLDWLTRWNLEAGQPTEALAAARRLAESGDTPGWRQIGHHLAGTAARTLGKPAVAIAAFTAAAADGLPTRETADAHFQLGQLALEDQRPADAITAFTEAAARADPDRALDLRARAYLQLGIAHEALDQWAEASRFYLSVSVLFDDPAVTPEALYRAAGALHAREQNGERDRLLAELRNHYPDSDWATRAAERWPPPPAPEPSAAPTPGATAP
jgi:tetratricopeptide (TPR) repeat protein